MAFKHPVGQPQDALGLWASHEADLRLAGCSPATINARRVIFTRATVAKDLADLNAADIRAFIADPAFSPATRHTYLSHFVSFYKWALHNDLLEHDPTVKIPRTRVKPGLPNPIQHADLGKALASAKPRVRLWLMLGAYAGLRCAEIAKIQRADIRGGNLVVRGKGDKERAVPLHPELASALATWPGDGYLFPGSEGRAYTSPSYVSQLIAAHLKSLGIASTAHKARHRFGTDIYNAEHDILATSRLLGHASVVTTQVYAQVDEPSLARMVGRLSYG